MIFAQRGDNSLFPKSEMLCLPECRLNAFFENIQRLLFSDVSCQLLCCSVNFICRCLHSCFFTTVSLCLRYMLETTSCFGSPKSAFIVNYFLYPTVCFIFRRHVILRQGRRGDPDLFGLAKEPKSSSVVVISILPKSSSLVVTTVVISNFLALPLGPKSSSNVVISILRKGFSVVVTTVVISNLFCLAKRSKSSSIVVISILLKDFSVVTTVVISNFLALPLGPMLCSHVIFLFKWWMGGFSRFLNAMYV